MKAKGILSTHPCRAVGCNAQIGKPFLMCKRHWSMVPKHLQTAVYRAWRAIQTDDPHRFSKYREAVLAAVDAVQAREEGVKP